MNNSSVRNILEELRAKSKEPKSPLFEKAIEVMKEREEVIYNRMMDYVKNGEKSFLDFDALMQEIDKREE